MICIRRIKAEACGCRRTAEDNKIAHAVAKACAENTENPCLADFGWTWVFEFGFNFLFLYFMNMYIGNLSYNVRESDLRQVMEEYGTVESVKLIMDRNTNRSKGFAFVEMPEAAEAQQAINKLNGAEYVGRQMVVKEALPRN